MRYEVIRAGTIERLEKQVNQRFKDGWELAGSMSVIAYNDGQPNWFYQPMVRGLRGSASVAHVGEKGLSWY